MVCYSCSCRDNESRIDELECNISNIENNIMILNNNIQNLITDKRTLNLYLCKFNKIFYFNQHDKLVGLLTNDKEILLELKKNLEFPYSLNGGFCLPEKLLKDLLFLIDL